MNRKGEEEQHSREILWTENERDLQGVPEDVRGELAFITVETVEEVLKGGPGNRSPAGLRCAAHGEQLRSRAECVTGIIIFFSGTSPPALKKFKKDMPVSFAGQKGGTINPNEILL